MSSDLEKRVQRLEDERAILDLLAKYGHGLDYPKRDMWKDLFTPTSKLWYTARGMHIPSVIVPQPQGGFTAIERAQYAAKHPHAPDSWHKHCISAPVIEFTSDTTAKAETYFFRLDETTEQGAAYVLAFGKYEDEVVKCDDGKWRFQYRKAIIENKFGFPRASMQIEYVDFNKPKE